MSAIKHTMSKLYIPAFTLLLVFILNCVNSPKIVNPSSKNKTTRAIALNENKFDSLVIFDKKVSVVEFYSSRCMLCQSVMWIIDSLAKEFGDSIVVATVDVDSNQNLVTRFSVKSVPTYIFFRNGVMWTRRSYSSEQTGMYDTLTALVKAILADTFSLTSDTLSPDTSSFDSGTDTSKTSDTIINNYITLDSLSFDSTVLRYGRVAMVFFLYPGGAPCIRMDSVVASFAGQYQNKAIIAKVHAWQQHSLSSRYDIYSVPRFLFFKDSVLIEQRSGVVSADTLMEILNRLLTRNVSLIEPVKSDISDSGSLLNLWGIHVVMVNFSPSFCSEYRSMNTALPEKYQNRAIVGKVNVTENTSFNLNSAVGCGAAAAIC